MRTSLCGRHSSLATPRPGSICPRVRRFFHLVIGTLARRQNVGVGLRLALQFKHSRQDAVEVSEPDDRNDSDLCQFSINVGKPAIVDAVCAVVYYNTLGKLSELSHRERGRLLDQ